MGKPEAPMSHASTVGKSAALLSALSVQLETEEISRQAATADTQAAANALEQEFGLPHQREEWDQLTPEQKDAALVLGFTPSSWPAPATLATVEKPWQYLDGQEREAALELGWTELQWDEEGSSASNDEAEGEDEPPKPERTGSAFLDRLDRQHVEKKAATALQAGWRGHLVRARARTAQRVEDGQHAGDMLASWNSLAAPEPAPAPDLASELKDIESQLAELLQKQEAATARLVRGEAPEEDEPDEAAERQQAELKTSLQTVPMAELQHQADAAGITEQQLAVALALGGDAARAAGVELVLSAATAAAAAGRIAAERAALERSGPARSS
jgi:hypothetical protein